MSECAYLLVGSQQKRRLELCLQSNPVGSPAFFLWEPTREPAQSHALYTSHACLILVQSKGTIRSERGGGVWWKVKEGRGGLVGIILGGT